MLELHDLCAKAAPAAGIEWLDAAVHTLRADPTRLPATFPQLPRRLGREYLSTGERRASDDVVVDTGAWRACDAGALTLLHTLFAPHATQVDAGAALCDLYDRGDLEERTMVLRALSCLPIGPHTGRLLRDVQRTNQLVHFAAAALDSNLCVRALRAPDSGFAQEDFDRLILKIAFVDLPLARVFDAESCASPELTRMLMGLATEREAAGRKVWHDTNRMIARAPIDGTEARLIGGLECGDDAHRLAAAEGIAALGRREVARYVAQRLPREESPRIRAALERAADALGGA